MALTLISFPDFTKLEIGHYPNHCLASSITRPSASVLPFFPQRKLRTSALVAAKRDQNKKKPDSHSFLPRPDEVTGPFPEAVLLKERKVEKKDGRLVPEFVDAEEEALFEALTLELESKLNVEQMRHYEVVYLIHEDFKDDVESVNMKVQGFIREKKGRIWRFSDWGMRKLAYKIKKAKNAHYILLNFELDAKMINDFNSTLDKDERVIRHLVMKRDRAETEDCPPPPLFHSLTDHSEWEDSEFDDEDLIDEDDDEIDMSSFGDNAEGIIYVDKDDADDIINEKNQPRSLTEEREKPGNVKGAVRRKQNAEKILR